MRPLTGRYGAWTIMYPPKVMDSREERKVDREDLEGILDIDSSHQATIDLMVRELIATRGYDSVIEKLIASVYNLGEISLADPGNSTKLRDFDMWAAAVRAAIVRHHLEWEFDAIVTDLDHHLAAQMGIRLG